jgi:hypothetical protein
MATDPFNLLNPSAQTAPSTTFATQPTSQGTLGAFDWNQEGDTNRLAPLGSTGYQGAYTAPTRTAEQIAQDNRNAATLTNFNNGTNEMYRSSAEAADTAGTAYGQGIRSWLTELGIGQDALNSRGAAAEMNKQAGTQGVLNMVGRGIRSGGVMLANKNAGDSSAAGALARLYGDLGDRTLQSDVNNPYALEMGAISTEQGAFDKRKTDELTTLAEDKTTIVNNVVNAARTEINRLNGMMTDATLPQRIALEQAIQTVRDDATAELSKYDTEVAKAGNVKAQDDGTRRSKGAEMLSAGKAAPGAFNFTTEMPSQFQGTGPFASELPLFTYGRGNKKSQ